MSDRLVFGHMHEDHSTELALAFHLPVPRTLVIASGGDLAFTLAGAGVQVLAVDSNPAQIELVRQKMDEPDEALALCFGGRVDRVLRLGGPLIAWLMDWPRLQPGRFRTLLTNIMETLLGTAVLVLHGRAAGRKLTRTAVRLLRTRFEKALLHGNAGQNPLLQVLLGKRFGPVIPAVWSPSGIAHWTSARHRIELRHADLGKILAETPPGTYGLISVSNLPDTMGQAAWDLLVEQAAAALTPGGYLIARSMLQETLTSKNDTLFNLQTTGQEDTSPLCPVVWTGKKCLT